MACKDSYINENIDDDYKLVHEILHDGEGTFMPEGSLEDTARVKIEKLTTGRFFRLYQIEKASMVREIFSFLTDSADDAIIVMKEIIADRDTNNATRLQACQSLLNYVRSFGSDLEKLDKDVIANADHDRKWGNIS